MYISRELQPLFISFKNLAFPNGCVRIVFFLWRNKKCKIDQNLKKTDQKLISSLHRLPISVEISFEFSCEVTEIANICGLVPKMTF